MGRLGEMVMGHWALQSSSVRFNSKLALMISTLCCGLALLQMKSHGNYSYILVLFRMETSNSSNPFPNLPWIGNLPQPGRARQSSITKRPPIFKSSRISESDPSTKWI